MSPRVVVAGFDISRINYHVLGRVKVLMMSSSLYIHT